VVFTRPGTAGMEVLLTHKGKQLIQRMAKRNAALARKHKRRLKLKIALTYTFAPVHGKAITVSRKLTITPKLASKHHGRR
jgi:hypothetical protein